MKMHVCEDACMHIGIAMHAFKYVCTWICVHACMLEMRACIWNACTSTHAYTCMRRCVHVEMRACGVACMRGCAHGGMDACEDVHIWRRVHVKMRTCGGAHMWRCVHVEMRTCGDPGIRVVNECTHAAVHACGVACMWRCSICKCGDACMHVGNACMHAEINACMWRCTHLKMCACGDTCLWRCVHECGNAGGWRYCECMQHARQQKHTILKRWGNASIGGFRVWIRVRVGTRVTTRLGFQGQDYGMGTVYMTTTWIDEQRHNMHAYLLPRRQQRHVWPFLNDQFFLYGIYQFVLLRYKSIVSKLGWWEHCAICLGWPMTCVLSVTCVFPMRDEQWVGPRIT